MRRARRDNGGAGQLRKLDGQRPRRGAAAIDQDGRAVEGLVSREGQL